MCARFFLALLCGSTSTSKQQAHANTMRTDLAHSSDGRSLEVLAQRMGLWMASSSGVSHRCDTSTSNRKKCSKCDQKLCKSCWGDAQIMATWSPLFSDVGFAKSIALRSSLLSDTAECFRDVQGVGDRMSSYRRSSEGDSGRTVFANQMCR